MNMGDIEVFIAVYEEGSIARAANRLYISPQGLSKSIARIESGLGFLLFHRSAQGMVPTRYARLLYPAAVNFIRGKKTTGYACGGWVVPPGRA